MAELYLSHESVVCVGKGEDRDNMKQGFYDIALRKLPDGDAARAGSERLVTKWELK
jgi:hypothetical protein